MKKHVLIGLLIAVALLGLIGVGAAFGDHGGNGGDSRQAAKPMDCLPPGSCG